MPGMAVNVAPDGQFGGLAVKTLTLVLLAAAFLGTRYAGAQAIDGHDVTWVVVQDDDGEYESHWGTAIIPRQRIRKNLALGIAPTQLRAARISYVVGFVPYHSKSRKHLDVHQDGIVWANVLVTLNGTVVARRPGVELMSKGKHLLEVPLELLRQGENQVEFGWEARTEATPREASYGYFYIGIDTDRKTRGSCSTNDGGKSWSFDCLRSGFKPEPLCQGEYLIRLEVALPNGEPGKELNK